MSTIAVTAASFMRAFDAVEHAASRDFKRPILTTILLEIDDAGARLVAADNYRIAIGDLDITDAGNVVGRYPLDRIALTAVRKALTKTVESVRFSSVPPAMVISWPGWSATVLIMDGKFPEYAKVLPKAAPFVVALHATFLGDLRRLAKGAPAGLAVRIIDPLSPVVFEGVGVREVIMPVRTARWPGVVGSVSGDDTVFIACRDVSTAFRAHLWPEPREREMGLPFVVAALLVGVLLAAFLFLLPFVGLVLGAALGVEMGGTQ